MKKLPYLSLFLLIALLTMGLKPYSIEKTSATNEAKIVLERYFHHLKKGDTTGILNLITGPLLKKRGDLLRNQARYGHFLRRRYKNSKISINPKAFMYNKKMSLKATIFFDDKESLNLIFTFSKDGENGRIKIYSEEEL